MIIKAFLGALFFSVATVPLASAYGGGGGGLLRPSCTPPSFSGHSPPKDAVIPSFSEFSFVTSPNTDKSTVVVKINGQPVEVMMTEKGYGGWLITGKPPQAITEPGFVTISLSAASTPGCTENYAYRVKVGG